MHNTHFTVLFSSRLLTELLLKSLINFAPIESFSQSCVNIV